MKVLITGATGFVGSHLARLLAREGHEVHALAHPGHSKDLIADLRGRIDLIECDLLDAAESAAAIAGIHAEMCLHLAWITTPGEYLRAPINLDLAAASVRLARAMALAGCRRMVSIGTCFEYDTTAGVLSETSPTRPLTLYAASKLSLLTALDAFCRHAGISFAWPRLFYLYGPGEHPTRLVPTLIQSFLRRAPARMTSGEKIRDYLYVEDVASAVLSVAQSDLTGPVNIGSGLPTTIRDVAETISSIIGVSGLAQYDARPDDPADPRHVQADNRLLASTGWSQRHSLEEGLRLTVDWWRRLPPAA